MSTASTELAAGTVDITTAKPVATDGNEWSPFNAHEWHGGDSDTEKLRTLEKLCRTKVIRATYRSFKGQSGIRIRVYISTSKAHGYEAARLLLRLMYWLDRRPELFDGTPTQLNASPVNPFTGEAQTLGVIFHEVPSPSPVDLGADRDPEILQLMDDVLSLPHPRGMKNALYGYQKRSLWKILQRELMPAHIPQLEYISLQNVQGISYYLNQFNGFVTTQLPMRPDIPGGIICEQMGTGKTCISLAAVMVTRHLPSPMDAHALIPDAERSVNINGQSASSHAAAEPRKSLSGQNAKRYRMTLRSQTRNGSPFPADSDRQQKDEQNTRKAYPSRATLVIVPDNLVPQWINEIHKHIHDGDLKWTALGNIKDEIPEVDDLLDLDLLLISQSRFVKENSAENSGVQENLGKRTRRETETSDIETIERKVCPLFAVHWRRVIIDEGHRLCTSTVFSELTAALLASAKWICTSTLTQSFSEPTSLNDPSVSMHDKLKRLGTLYTKILQFKPFKSVDYSVDMELTQTCRAWTMLISKPLSNEEPYATARLKELFNRTMIRTREDDIEREVKLPPLYKSQVLLNFDYFQWMAYNCQVAMVGLNAILSKHKGRDYIFDPENTKEIQEAVHNLCQSCFWRSVESRWLQASHDNCVVTVDAIENGEKNFGDDNDTLRQIKTVLDDALSDRLFVEMMDKHSPLYIVSGLPRLLKEKWGCSRGVPGVYAQEDICVVEGGIMYNLKKNIELAADHLRSIYVHNVTDNFVETVEGYQEKREQRMIEKAYQDPVDDEAQKRVELVFYNANAFKDTKVLCSTSTKVNYLIDEIRERQHSEKCVIFAQHQEEVQEIGAALQLANVNVLMYNDSKAQSLSIFNTSKDLNVVVMALQKAAIGIDLSSATRIYFVGPVWQTALEQHAIKRVHRLGQTKPVHVQTLVARGTFEHQLLELLCQENEETRLKDDSYADSRVRDILDRVNFVPLPSHIKRKPESGDFEQPVRRLKTTLSLVGPEYDHEESLNVTAAKKTGGSKKSKSVCFAE